MRSTDYTRVKGTSLLIAKYKYEELFKNDFEITPFLFITYMHF